jgi:hypothetical protein
MHHCDTQLQDVVSSAAGGTRPHYLLGFKTGCSSTIVLEYAMFVLSAAMAKKG